MKHATIIFNSSVKHLPSFGQLTSTLSLHYRVKCRSRSLVIDNNEFLPGSVCVSSEIINRIATNVKKSHVPYHIIFISSCAQNVLLQRKRKRWTLTPFANSTFSNCMTQAAHSLLVYHFSLSTYQDSFKIKTRQQIFNDFVVSVIF